MPLVRIDLSKNAPAERIRVVSEVVYKAMIEIANVPANDKFQIITRHESDEMIYPSEGYLGMEYTPDIIVIQVTWVGGRSVDVKKTIGKSPTKFMPGRTYESKTSGSVLLIPLGKIGRSETERCSMHQMTVPDLAFVTASGR